MGQCLLIQKFSRGQTLKNYVPCAVSGAKTIAELLTGEVSIYELKDTFSKTASKTRVATIQLDTGSGFNRFLSFRVSSDETEDSIKDKLLPITIGDETFTNANVSLTQLL